MVCLKDVATNNSKENFRLVPNAYAIKLSRLPPDELAGASSPSAMYLPVTLPGAPRCRRFRANAMLHRDFP